MSLKEWHSLFPSKVMISYVESVPSDYQLQPKESKLTLKMSKIRLEEFRLSRYCAKKALAQLGVQNYPIIINSFRAPVWPKNIVGSISHCERRCLTVVAENINMKGIGVDIEIFAPLKTDMLEIICTKKESLMFKDGKVSLVFATIIFSIKESIFKCLHPLYQKWIDFQEVEIEFLSDNNWSATLSEELQVFFNRTKILGEWSKISNLIVTRCWIN